MEDGMGGGADPKGHPCGFLEILKTAFLGTLWDVAPADPLVHIFYKELEAVVWAVEVMALRYPGKVIVLATDNRRYRGNASLSVATTKLEK